MYIAKFMFPELVSQSDCSYTIYKPSLQAAEVEGNAIRPAPPVWTV